MDGSVVFARWRQCALWSNTLFPDPIRLSIPSCISISSAIFIQLTAEGPYTLQWAAIHPPPRKKCSLVHGPLSNTWFLGSTLVHPKSTHRSVRPFLHGSQSWQTDHGTLSVAHTHTHNHFTALFSGTTRVSRCQKRTSRLCGARED